MSTATADVPAASGAERDRSGEGPRLGTPKPTAPLQPDHQPGARVVLDDQGGVR
jgi:hypothetical protein